MMQRHSSSLLDFASEAMLIGCSWCPKSDCYSDEEEDCNDDAKEDTPLLPRLVQNKIKVSNPPLHL